MRTIFIKNENDYASFISELCGKTFVAKDSRELCKACEEAAPILCGKTMDDVASYREPLYAPTVHIAISKKNAHAIDAFFKEKDRTRDDYLYLDTAEYEAYDSIDAVPTDKVDFSFVVDDLAEIEKLIGDVAAKLSELGEDADFLLNYLVPMREGAIEYENGEREVGDPALVWEIRDGKVKNPNAKIVIFGADRDALVYYGYNLVANVLEASWKQLFNVDIVVEV